MLTDVLGDIRKHFCMDVQVNRAYLFWLVSHSIGDKDKVSTSSLIVRNDDEDVHEDIHRDVRTQSVRTFARKSVRTSVRTLVKTLARR